MLPTLLHRIGSVAATNCCLPIRDFYFHSDLTESRLENAVQRGIVWPHASAMTGGCVNSPPKQVPDRHCMHEVFSTYSLRSFSSTPFLSLTFPARLISCIMSNKDYYGGGQPQGGYYPPQGALKTLRSLWMAMLILSIRWSPTRILPSAAPTVLPRSTWLRARRLPASAAAPNRIRVRFLWYPEHLIYS